MTIVSAGIKKLLILAASMILDFFTKNKNYLIVVFTIGYLVAFTANGLLQGNLEFLYYTILMAGLIFVVVSLNKHLHLAFFIIFNLSLLGFFHLLGGNFYFNGIRLYDYYFFFGLLRYDNIIHVYGTFVVTLVLYSLVSPFVHVRLRKRFPIFAIGLVLMAIGAGVINELVEFFAVIYLGAAEQVGGYFNNALDLIFNTLGSILATAVIYWYLERPRLLNRLKKS
jgi:hypothetical protein